MGAPVGARGAPQTPPPTPPSPSLLQPSPLDPSPSPSPSPSSPSPTARNSTTHHRRRSLYTLPRNRPRPHCRSFSIPESDVDFCSNAGPPHSLVSRLHADFVAGPGSTVDNKQHSLYRHNYYNQHRRNNRIHVSDASDSPPTSPRSPSSPRALDHYFSVHQSSIAGRVPRVHSLDMALARSRASPLQMPVPDSPPELSSSKSSKSSSSFRSSILSDTVGPESATHFEDISLADNKRDSYDLNALGAKEGRSRPHARPMHSMLGARKKPFPTVDTMRSVHMAKGRPAPSVRPAGVLDDRSTNLPIGRARPGIRTVSGSYAPSSPTNAAHSSRSPSPSSKATRSPGLTRSAASAPNGFLDIHHIKKKSWAPGQRKTVKQLEDEYHDSDEDVPEDAVIWNVPLSPLEPFAAISRDPSPRRQSSQSSLSSNGKSNALDRYPSAPTPTAGEFKPPSPRHNLALPRSATTGHFPDHIGDALSMHERHQSWTNALSEDARHLSEALEAHAITSNSPPEPSRMLQRAQTSYVTLPPIQKSNNMIDPLPISKEKEAVLTRTRPSWLPPKSQKEERRHLKEWEQMMAHSAIADRRRAARKLDEIETARHTHSSMDRIWEDHVLPNWSRAITEPRTRELWWRGISSKARGNVWKKAIGNDLHLNAASYNAALGRSLSSLEPSIIDQINQDASTTYPETGLFAVGAPLHSSLIDVLRAQSAYRPDVGYVSGMHRVAALLLINMSAEDAFITLANVLSRPLPLAFLTNDKAGINKWITAAMTAMKTSLPTLYDHLLSEKTSVTIQSKEPQSDERSVHTSRASSPAIDSVAGSRPSSRDGPTSSQEIKAKEFIAPMLSTMFTAHLDLDTLSRIWDIYVFESDGFLVRAFVRLCARVESSLYGSRNEILAVLGQKGQTSDIWRSLGDTDDLIRSIREGCKADRI